MIYMARFKFQAYRISEPMLQQFYYTVSKIGIFEHSQTVKKDYIKATAEGRIWTKYGH